MRSGDEDLIGGIVLHSENRRVRKSRSKPAPVGKVRRRSDKDASIRADNNEPPLTPVA
jgi:hypothetical protein